MSAWRVLATALVATARAVAGSSTACFGVPQTSIWPRIPNIPKIASYRRCARNRTRSIGSPSSGGFIMRSAQGDGTPARRWYGERGSTLRRRATDAPGSAKHDVADMSLADANALINHPNLDESSRPGSSRRPQGHSGLRGLLLLATVPLVWGTYGPSVKYLYQMGESTPGLVFNFGCYLVSASTLALVAWVNDLRHRGGAAAVDDKAIDPEDKATAGRYAACAGLELGGWLFLGGTVQVWGLGLTSASRAAFLVQLTTVMVPVMEAFGGRRKLRPQVWLACALATVGVALVSLGGVLPPGANALEYIKGALSSARLAPSTWWDSAMSGNILGDLLVACSALFYSLHVVRLGVHVAKVETMSLARAKAFAELGFSAASVVVAGFIGGQGETFARFATALASKPDFLAVFVGTLVWNGALTSAYAMWAQTRGQAAVAPSEANLVYSLQPLFSTFFAVALLKETFRGVDMAGAAVVLLSLLLVTFDGRANESHVFDRGAIVGDHGKPE